jgi:3'-phosphoadenosine 5'-phosphosulfate sulfotransferase (PAPS reductase)/FAD synthetase
MEKYGFPSPSRYREGVPKCCYYLKEKPFKKWCKLLRIDLIFTGISAFESRSRKLAIHRHGLIFKSKRWGAMRCHPIALWNEMDVWKYIEENKLPVNQAYEKYGLERIGCKFCTNYPGWEKVVSRIHPKTYRRIKRMMGEPVLDEFS